MKVVCFAAALLVLLSACSPKDMLKDKVDSAEKQVKLGDYKGAIDLYETALDGGKNSAEIHYRIAVLYDDKLKEPLDAIHHYNRCQELEPNGPHAREVKEARADCEKRLQTRMTQGGYMTLGEGARLKNENESLRKTIAELRAPKPAPGAAVVDPKPNEPLPEGTRRHTVAKGETLASIALKYYNSRAEAAQIKDANFNQLGGKDIIKPGQVLIIPEIPKARKKK